jgi:antitoxin component YwqK of YwqJK toxin-antitoxin module
MKSAAEYKHGKLDGLYTEWYEDGTKSAEINYMDGVKHGDTIRWHKNSQVKLNARYKYGNLDGLHTACYENKQAKSFSAYRNHKLHCIYKEWHKNGQIKLTARYKDGKRMLTPVFTAWHANGNKSIEVNYYRGHRHGTCTLWYKDGSKRSEITYDNGKMNNLWVVWHSTGQIKKAVLFKDYRKKSKTTWYSNGSIKYNSELGSEYFNRQLYKFSDVSYDEWIDYYSPCTFDDDFFPNVRGPMGEGVRHPILMTCWYKSGQKSYESIQYGYEDSHIYWHENGKKSFEAGNVKDIPNTYWNDQGVKEYECLYNLDSDETVDWKISYKFFDADEHHIVTIIQIEDFDKFIQWEFFDALNNKLYDYKFNYSKDRLITDGELWGIWLSSERKEFVKILKSVEKHKSEFCRITNYN